MPFCLDTSAILDAWARYYPIDVFPTIWERMDSAAKLGQILVIDEVLAELKRKDDGSFERIEERKSMIVAIDEAIQTHLGQIMKNYPRMVDTRKNRSGCDPWVVALARAQNLIVVTAEKPTGSLTRPKIPDVCQDLAIPCIEVIEFFRKQGWKL